MTALELKCRFFGLLLKSLFFLFRFELFFSFFFGFKVFLIFYLFLFYKLLRFFCFSSFVKGCRKQYLLFHAFGQEVVDFLTLLQSLLHVNQIVDTVDNLLNQLHLGMPETIQVGEIEGSTDSSCVNTTSSSLLETVRFENVVETLVLGQVGKLDVDT